MRRGNVFYSPEKAKAEKEEKTKAQLDNERRTKYFERLRNDKYFQKYVIEEIIDREIKENQDLSASIKSLIGSSPEEVKSMLVAKSGGLASSQNIKNRILNPIA